MKKAAQKRPNQRLREERKQHYWTQSQMAEQLGTTVVNVNRWEQGITVPGLYFRQKLCELFQKSAEELGLVPETEKQERMGASPAPARPLLWNIPFRRNPYFTGRQEVLARLEAVLQTDKHATLAQTQAISGLGGIGKTQTAVEYAYRHQSDYRAVLWAKADSRELLTSDYVELAALLHLPEKDEQDQGQVVGAVKGWLRDYPDWLLILDNVEEVELISDFLPSDSKGHILLTTRAQSTGTVAERIELEKLVPEEGALLLLRRAKLLSPDIPLERASSSDRAKALELARLMDGLPLALDQAAAYIEETDCNLSGYLERYQTRRVQLLNLRGSATLDHPEAVTTTWSLSFEKVQQANPAAADLLRLCTFLHPDAIPEEIIIKGSADLGPMLKSMATDPLALDAAIRELRKYSLLRRDPEAHLLQVHRLVQAVLQDTLEEKERHSWTGRAVHAINAAFPDVEHKTWQQCERLLPHALLATQYIEIDQIIGEEAGRLLYQMASYLRERADYVQAEPLFQRALHIWEQQLGPDHPDVATSLNNLASLYVDQGKYGQDQGKYEQAVTLYQRALHIWEQQLGPDHPDVGYPLNGLAEIYVKQGRYEQAELLYQRALHICEQQLGSDHPRVAYPLNGLAEIHVKQDKYEQAKPLFRRALRILEQRLGPDHPDVAGSLNGLADLYTRQGKYEQVEPLYQRVLRIREQVLGSEHPDVVDVIEKYADLLRKTNREEEAVKLENRYRIFQVKPSQEASL